MTRDLDALRDLPVSAGLIIRRDVKEVEEFYALVSGLKERLIGVSPVGLSSRYAVVLSEDDCPMEGEEGEKGAAQSLDAGEALGISGLVAGCVSGLSLLGECYATISRYL